MRAVAQAAIKQGHTLGTLAKALNEHDQTCLEATNIRSHFDSRRPREGTVDAYARVLEIDAEDLRVLSGARDLSGHRIRQQLALLKKSLLLKISEFEAAAIDEALALIDSAQMDVQTRIATQYFRSSNVTATFQANAVAAAFDGVLDLRTRKRLPNEQFLFMLWLEAKNGVGLDGAETVVALAVGLLRRRGVDTAHYEERLILERTAFDMFLSEALVK